MCFEVALEVVRNEVVVAMFSDAVDESGEWSLVAERATLNGVEDLLQLRVDLVLAVEVRVAEIFNVLGQISEKEDVLVACLTRDFNLI